MVRVRIAPSPTGVPHIGNTRTALFNWLFARHNNGKFILRIEDTDRQRLIPESVNSIYQILDWLGLNCDESPRDGGSYSPYVQSQRLAIYQKYAHQLIDNGHAYYCFCTDDRLFKLRQLQATQKKPPKYDRLCLSLKPAEIKTKIIRGKPHVVRIKIPDHGQSSWNDLIHGQISFNNNQLDDAVILKSDGFPTYHLAVVVDDSLMKISHVLRGDEWISSTPKHLLLYQFLKLKPPQFGHFPLILGPDKTKLSKRHGAMSVLEYRDLGYLPEALINFMVLLGWSPKTDEELFSLDQLVKLFDLAKINPTSPVFNLKKLDWFNGQWIRRLPAVDLMARLKAFVPTDWDDKLIEKVLPLVSQRINTLKEFATSADFFFEEPKIDFKLIKDQNQRTFLRKLAAEFQPIAWKKNHIEDVTRELITSLKLDNKDSFMILRIAITGKTIGPPLFESIEILDKNRIIARLKNASQDQQ